MRLTFLGKDTQGGNSPTLWETDDGQYVIQGFTLDAEALGQQALHTNVGGTEVMAGQLEHLLTVLRLPRLRLGIIPFDAPYRVPLNNGFWILDEALVQFDTYSAELSLVRPDEIALYGRAFERLAALAVYGAEAKAILARTLDRLTAKSS